MKKLNRFGIVAGAALLLASVSGSYAQSQLSGDNGTAASPKTRQMQEERKAVRSAAVDGMGASEVTSSKEACCTTSDGRQIAASPKVQQMLAERRAKTCSPVATRSDSEVAGYKATGDDGITASPKVRQMLNERRSSVQIAPLK